MSIISTAESLIGKVTYKFGGDNIEGGYGDCSDFTQYVFKENGYEIGGTTEAQYSQGKEVKKDDLEKNDLVFFKDTYDSNYKDGVSHVGIYIGNNKFIHLSSDGVKESSLDSDYWQEHYLSARRIEGASESTGSSEDKDLVWWGDIVKVVLIALLFVGAVVAIIFAVN